MGVQILNRPEISRFLPYMLQFLDNSRRIFITSRWFFRIGSILNAGLSEKFLIVDHPKEE